MHRIFSATLAFLLLGLTGQAARADTYSDTVNAFRNAGASGEFFKSAYGYAVFPTIGKGAVVIGGAYGEGRVYAAGQYVGNTTMTQASVGFQLGGQAFSQIIFFEDEGAYRDFTSGNFEFSAEANAVVITAGASADASTTGGLAAGASGGRNDAVTVSKGYRRGMAIFTIARGGLMAGISLAGQKFSYTPLTAPAAPAAQPQAAPAAPPATSYPATSYPAYPQGAQPQHPQ